MISLFESVGSAPELPVDLVKPGGRGVALLEFTTVEDESSPSDDSEQRSAEEIISDERALQVRVMIDSAREQAHVETRNALGAEYEARLIRERGQLASALSRFMQDRESYFAEAEAQVVRLALAIAAKILHKEVGGDTVQLMHTVHAALNRVTDGSAVTLHVRPEEVEGWRRVMADAGEVKVRLEGDSSLAVGDCVLETAIGRVELGIAAQLGEIEQEFLRLLAKTGAFPSSNEEGRVSHEH
jgi:flagellar assembly protein FliH